MFHTIMAIELLVQDLAGCTAFYRDTLGLEVRESESTSDSVSFQGYRRRVSLDIDFYDWSTLSEARSRQL